MSKQGITYFNEGQVKITVHSDGILAVDIKGCYAQSTSPVYGVGDPKLEVHQQWNFSKDAEDTVATDLLHDLFVAAADALVLVKSIKEGAK